jgi:hypothetical protein
LDAVAAFVVFNYSESMARCVEDYRLYSSPLYSACYPEELLFKGARIRIEKAPEPFEVNFENLEIPASDKLWYQVRSNVAIFGIFFLGLVFLLAGATYQNMAAGAIPTAEMCSAIIPATFVQSSGASVRNAVLRRPTDSQVNLVSYASTVTVPVPVSVCVRLSVHVNPPSLTHSLSLAHSLSLTHTLTHSLTPHRTQTHVHTLKPGTGGARSI